MDIARPDILLRKRRLHRILGGIGISILVLMAVGLSRMKPALPIMRGEAFTDSVKRGEMLREVRGSGALVPEEIRWVTASSPGRIENILLLPGVSVQADTVLVELSNPELEQAAFEAESQWRAGETQLERLRIQLESERLTQRSVVATLKADLAQAGIEAEADEALFKDGLVPALTAKRTRSRASELQERYDLEQERLALSGRSISAQLEVQKGETTRLRKQYELKERQLESLKVRAGIAGVLQRLGDEKPLQVGQQLAVGASIARIANSEKLKAQIKVGETQARDIQFEQHALIDTHNGTVPGRVVRIDPAVQNGTVMVDIQLPGPLPKGVRPDLSVQGIITLERLENVLHVSRPVNAQPESSVRLFKVVDDGRRAVKVPVRFGRASVSSIEIAQGLSAGDQIILSDTSHYDQYDQIRLK